MPFVLSKRPSVLVAALLLSAACEVAHAYQRPAMDRPGTVRLDNRTLFVLKARVGSILPTDRSRIVEERLLAIATDRSARTSDIAVNHGERGSEIVFGQEPLTTIRDEDADAGGADREAIAERYAQSIRRAIDTYRSERSVPTILRGIAYAAGVTALLLVVLRLFGLAFGRMATRLRSAASTRIRPLRIQQTNVLTPEQITAALLWLLDAIRITALALLIYAYLTLVFGFFAWTEGYAATLLGYLTSQVRTVGQAIVAAVPNLLLVALIAVITRFLLKAIRFFFHEIEIGAIGFAGFEREWAVPTFKLVRLLVLALAVVAAFPYVPGSRSPAFQGVSVLIGLLLSFGSSNAVGNMVAGVVLTYMRPFRVGDRVKIADTMGDVIEKSMLVTRLKTTKNVEVTIPNSMVLGAHIVNYSANAKSGELTLHTTVTIGYDVPWRQVHALLIAAARKTPEISGRPAPYVLQTGLDDHYVAYELNAFTSQANRMATVYSMLHQNIQDAFNEAGVEIMSPHYHAIRDGNRMAVPENSLPTGYEAPGFRVVTSDHRTE